jgi:hypothetical protein
MGAAMPCSFRARREERGYVVTHYGKASLLSSLQKESIKLSTFLARLWFHISEGYLLFR